MSVHKKLLTTVLAGLLPVWSVAAAEPMPEFEDVIRIEDQTVPRDSHVELQLPALPAKPGKEIVLHFRAVVGVERPGGCNINASVQWNGQSLGRFTASGDERLLFRPSSFGFVDDDRSFDVFHGAKLMVVYAPDADSGDALTRNGRGATFVMRISDLARGVDVNTLRVQNELDPSITTVGKGDLLVRDIYVGWVDRSALPRSDAAVPRRSQIHHEVQRDGVRLRQADRGGFSFINQAGVEMLVETAIGMTHDTPPSLYAEDGLEGDASSHVNVEPWGPQGFKVVATWPSIRLMRYLEIGADGLLHWRETWTNTSDEIVGLPFRHRFFHRDAGAHLRVGGSRDSSHMAAAAQNPTLFLASSSNIEQGMGVTAESDWLRLLMELRAAGGMGEMFTRSLALPPHGSIDFVLTVTPVDEGGYWRFINSVRERWGVNGIATVDRPIFWDYQVPSGIEDDVERYRQALGHLGPVTANTGPWLGMLHDVYAVRSGDFPRLPDGAPPTLGNQPDLDLEAFLTFKHREEQDRLFAKEFVALREALPDVTVIPRMHISMDAVYGPLFDRWPIAQDAIRREDGSPFEDPGYSVAWFQQEAVDHGWKIVYFMPRPGSAYMKELLDRVRHSLDEFGADGVYCDELSFAFATRGYSRYDYSRWDGYSADLNSDGTVRRLKTDNAHASEQAQLQIANEALRRGKIFMGNGGPALHSTSRLPIYHFVEGGNGEPWMSRAHLFTTPMILGNMGEQSSQAGIFASVRLCVQNGTVYSPNASNLLLQGKDNFVSKLYPFTIRAIGPGWVMAQERLIVTEAGEYDWPGKEAQVRLYRYDAEGNRIGLDDTEPRYVGPRIEVEVEQDGLTIAEVIHP